MVAEAAYIFNSGAEKSNGRALYLEPGIGTRAVQAGSLSGKPKS